MRNFATAVSATLTAIIIGLLIANVASAAKAAEIQHDKDSQLAMLQDTAYTADMTTQLEAYRTRYGQAYEQLAAAYKAYYTRDAEYRAIVGNANANAAQLAAANAALEARLNEAFQALRDAQALVTTLRSTTTTTPGAPTAPSQATRTSAPAPNATQPPSQRTPQPTQRGERD